jgi:hypothetical protein
MAYAKSFEGGLVYIDPFYSDSGSPVHVVEGHLEGRGPWRISDGAVDEQAYKLADLGE